MAAHGLTEHHERSLLASVQQAARLIHDAEEILAASDRPNPLNRYSGSLSPPQRTITEDYLRRLRQQLLRFLEVVAIAPPPPRNTAVHALCNTMMFLDSVLEEMRGRHLRGYGMVSAEAEHLLDGAISEMQAQVREVEDFLMGGGATTVTARLDRLDASDPLTGELRRLDDVITRHGLIDLRPSLSLVVERALEATFEVAIIGRVSSGKSSLLNALVGAPVLPTGVLPMTSVPTRLCHGEVPAFRLSFADGTTASFPVERLDEYVTESHNPGNEKRVARVLVEYPSDALPPGVTFVDTPGLGSVASRGALQTVAYLPRCDHATFLFDATAPLADEDLGLLAYLRDAGIETSVLLSKADLLSAADLQRVQHHVADAILKRVGTVARPRPVSVMPSHEAFLRTWIADEVAPLGAQAMARRREALHRKLAVLRGQAAAMLEQGLAATGSRAPVAPAPALAPLAAEFRDMSAAIEGASRDVAALPQRRQALVQAALADAAACLAGDGDERTDAARRAVEQSAAEESARVARSLEELTVRAERVLATAETALGLAAPPDTLRLPREVPVIAIPALPPIGAPPPWARVTQSMRRRWTTARLREQWAPTIEHAAAAYLDVLRRWAADVVEGIRQEFASRNRPLASQLSPTETPPGATADREGVMADLRWLREAGPPVATGGDGRASSIPEVAGR